MFKWQDDDDDFLKTFSDYILDLKAKYLSDFSQGFIRKSAYEYVFQSILQCRNMKRATYGNINLEKYHISIKDGRLYVNNILFREEENTEMSSPFAAYIRNSTKSVIYFNYTRNPENGKYTFFTQRDLTEIMTDYNLSYDEAVEYNKMLKQAELQNEYERANEYEK